MKKNLLIATLLICGTLIASAQQMTRFEDQSYLGNNTGNNLYKTAFVNADTGIAVGDSGIVLRTVDGGDNWTLRVTPKTYQNVVFTDVAVINTLTFFVCGADSSGDGILLKSVDMGQTWNIVPGSMKPDTGYSSIFFASPTIGYMSGGFGLIRKTVNGGTSWNDMPTPTTRLINDIFFNDPTHGFAIDTDRKLYRTTNGATWQMLGTGGADTTIISSIFFTNQDTGFIAHGDSVLMSQDSGKTWNAIFSTAGDVVTDIIVAGDGTGTLIGDNGKTWYTNDFGGTFNPQPLSAQFGSFPYSLFGTHIVNGNLLYIAGKFGALVKACHPPSANFTAPGNAPYNTVVNFTNTTTNGSAYKWDFGDGSPLDFSANPSHTYATSGLYIVTMIATNNSRCPDTVKRPIVITATIAGNVFKRDATTLVTDGKVFLFRKFPSLAKMTLVDSTSLDLSGYFEFLDRARGEYILMVKPDTSVTLFKNTLVTFMDSTFFWDKGKFVVNNIDKTNLKIFLKQRPSALPTGPARIRGRVIERDTINKMGPGDPLEGIDVSLVNGNGDPVANQSTSTGGASSGGFYAFNNIPTGQYSLFVNIPGVGMDTLQQLNVDSANLNLDNVIVEVDSNYIYVEVDSTTSVPKNKDDLKEYFNIYPNPVDDILHIVVNPEKAISARFEVYSLTGQLVFTQEALQLTEGRQNLIIDIRSVVPGTYILVLKSTPPSSLDGATSKFVIFRK